VNLTNVTYLAQETGSFCGPASAAMALDAAGVAGLSQADLYDHDCHRAPSIWSTTPDGLLATLVSRAADVNAAGFFALHALPDENAVSRLICWSIHQYRRPAIALVEGDAHWLVVTGYELAAGSADPVSAVDQTYAIVGFYVNDPFAAPSARNPHGRFEFIAYDAWRRNQLHHAVWDRPDPANHAYKDQFVSICGPVEPGFSPSPPPRHTFPDRNDGRVRTPDEAIEGALAGLNQEFFFENDIVRAGRTGTQPGRPLLIERLDRPADPSYLVPFQRDRGDDGRSTTQTALVNATSGVFEGVALAPGESDYLDEMLDPESMLARFADGVADPETGKRVPLERAKLWPALVWRMCRESQSIYWPFYRFDAGGGPIFIRLDGAVFFELHDALGD